MILPAIFSPPSPTIWDGTTPNHVNRNDHREMNEDDYDRIVAELLAMANFLYSTNYQPFVNDNAGSLPPGTPVYVKSNGHIDMATANGTGTRIVVGCVADATAVATGGTAHVAIDGLITLTTAQWDAIAGTSGGLTPGAMYWLSETAGHLVATAPVTVGDTVFRIGVALSATTMRLYLNYEKTD